MGKGKKKGKKKEEVEYMEDLRDKVEDWMRFDPKVHIPYMNSGKASSSAPPADASLAKKGYKIDFSSSVSSSSSASSKKRAGADEDEGEEEVLVIDPSMVESPMYVVDGIEGVASDSEFEVKTVEKEVEMNEANAAMFEEMSSDDASGNSDDDLQDWEGGEEGMGGMGGMGGDDEDEWKSLALLIAYALQNNDPAPFTPLQWQIIASQMHTLDLTLSALPSHPAAYSDDSDDSDADEDVVLAKRKRDSKPSHQTSKKHKPMTGTSTSKGEKGGKKSKKGKGKGNGNGNGKKGKGKKGKK